MPYVIDLDDLGLDDLPHVGGKAARLGELRRLDGITVPPGFCITTSAFDALPVGPAGSAEQRRTQLAHLAPPAAVTAAIRTALARHDPQTAWAVRSSATAEDLADASFAGQLDSYLDVVGAEEVLRHVRLCWASMYTDRAVAYRHRAGIRQDTVRTAVLVQQLVPAAASGVLFTADPTTSDRWTSTVEAVPGLGDAFASGQATAQSWTVRGSVVTGGDGVLAEHQVAELARLGRVIEQRFGAPQDIEWCLADGRFQIVQSRPITTLFPVPTPTDDDVHVYVSVGHQQMMTDAMRPLGLSLWQHTTPRPMAEAGCRLFVDVAPVLATASGRETLLETFDRSDPLVVDALRSVVDAGRIPPAPEPAAPQPAAPQPAAPEPVDAGDEPAPGIVTELIAANEASVATLQREIDARSGADLVQFVLDDLVELRRLLFDPLSHRVIMDGMHAKWWLDDHLGEWLGEGNASDTLVRSAPHDVSAEMGLALMDVADVVRPHPEARALLERVADRDEQGAAFLDELVEVPGGPEMAAALRGFLDTYGARCAGEIDVSRPRWSEHPATVVAMVVSGLRTASAGERERRVDDGVRAAGRARENLLRRVRELPDGEARATRTAMMIDRLRAFAGYREYPKFGMIRRYACYRQAFQRTADGLLAAGVIDDLTDVWFLRLPELAGAARTGVVDRAAIRSRRAEFAACEPLRPPRVITSDGEVPPVAHRHEVPPGALAGLPVSAGVAQGRARVVTDAGRADLRPGDVLVTTFTDPSWTPLFLSAAAVVTEVGGLMTHGAVVAREYGLPAVVGVAGATRVIRDGQQVRVDGSAGIVELLD